MIHPRGVPVVLTADRILMADHRTLFGGMIAASQTTTTPRVILSRFLAPRARGPVAPMGLRRVEAALLTDGFAESDMAVVEAERLAEVIGPNTRVIGISAGEACGWGMTSTTMTAISGGEIYSQRLVRELAGRIGRLRRRASGARVVLGGPGSWQLAANDDLRRALGIDHVVIGAAEGNVAQVFAHFVGRASSRPTELPPVIMGDGVPPERIPPIRGAATMGVVELSRGCGLGCNFCVMGRVPMAHLPAETILRDVTTNVAPWRGLPTCKSARRTAISAISEDILRYGARGHNPDPEALLGLLRRVRELPGVGLVQTDHANVISVAGWSDDRLRELRALMVGDTGARFPWINLGVETPSGELLARSAPAKLGNVDRARWGEFAAEQLRRLIAAGFMPMASLMLCLPGETEEHVREALRWVESLSTLPLTIFPIIYAPIDAAPPPGRENLSKLHWQLIARCYDINFREVPRMFADNERAAGVPASRRALLQALGRGQILPMRTLFGWRKFMSARAARARS